MAGSDGEDRRIGEELRDNQSRKPYTTPKVETDSEGEGERELCFDGVEVRIERWMVAHARRFNKSHVIEIDLGATKESNPPLRNRKAIIHQMRMKRSKEGVDQESIWYPHITQPTSEGTRTASQSPHNTPFKVR